MLDRRAFLGSLGLLAAPLAAEAQRTGTVARLGVLTLIAPSAADPSEEAFRIGLRERGYVEGQNIVIARRNAEGREERFQHVSHAATAPRALDESRRALKTGQSPRRHLQRDPAASDRSS